MGLVTGALRSRSSRFSPKQAEGSHFHSTCSFIASEKLRQRSYIMTASALLLDNEAAKVQIIPQPYALLYLEQP